MTSPEITPYGDSPLDGTREYLGLLYRFDGAEHIGLEKSDEAIVVYASTLHDPEDIAEAYEQAFGIPAVVEPFEDDDEVQDETESDADSRISASITLGPPGRVIVNDQNFRLVWQVPSQIFWDRDEEIAKVTMSQIGQELDLRHAALLASIVEKPVQMYLEQLLKAADS